MRTQGFPNMTAAASRALKTRQNEQVMFLVAASRNDQPDPPRLELRSDIPSHQKSQVSVAATPSSIGDVMQCIKEYESGDYAESSHPGSGSGAYQYIPSTWRVWAERAGHPGYEYAYLAPPYVQDAVTVYALTNGGAGNWSMRWGNDPCTSGMPGGG